MRRAKRFWAELFVLSLIVFFLSACGSGDAPSSSTPDSGQANATNTEKKKKGGIGMIGAAKGMNPAGAGAQKKSKYTAEQQEMRKKMGLVRAMSQYNIGSPGGKKVKKKGGGSFVPGGKFGYGKNKKGKASKKSRKKLKSKKSRQKNKNRNRNKRPR